MRYVLRIGLALVCLSILSFGGPASARIPTPYLSFAQLRQQAAAMVVGRLVGTAMADDSKVGIWATLDVQEVIQGPMPTGTVRILIYHTLEPYLPTTVPAKGESRLGRPTSLSPTGEPQGWLKPLHPQVGEVLSPAELWFYEWGAMIDAHIKALDQPQVWVLMRRDPISGKDDMPALGISLAQHVMPLQTKRYFTEPPQQ